jgi:hypothetical protein
MNAVERQCCALQRLRMPLENAATMPAPDLEQPSSDLAKATPSSPAARTTSWHAGLCVQIVPPALLTALLVAYMIVGSLVRYGDLQHEAINCCAPQHVVFGALGWYFPPLLLILGFYQLADHYGYWYDGTFGAERESWAATFGDIIDYAVGFALVYAVRWMRPIRVGCLRRAWRHWRRSGRCIDAPPCCVASICPGCVDPPVRPPDSPRV